MRANVVCFPMARASETTATTCQVTNDEVDFLGSSWDSATEATTECQMWGFGQNKRLIRSVNSNGRQIVLFCEESRAGPLAKDCRPDKAKPCKAKIVLNNTDGVWTPDKAK